MVSFDVGVLAIRPEGGKLSRLKDFAKVGGSTWQIGKKSRSSLIST